MNRKERRKDISKNILHSKTFVAKKDSLKEEVLEDGSVKFLIEWFASTETKDGSWDIVKVEWIDIKRYLQNPVLQRGHKRWSENTIGKVTSITKKKGEWLYIKAEVILNAEIEDHKSTIHGLRHWLINWFSIWFMDLKASYDEKAEANIIEKLELFEISLVDIPDNPLTVRKFIDNIVDKKDLEEEKEEETPVETVEETPKTEEEATEPTIIPEEKEDVKEEIIEEAIEVEIVEEEEEEIKEEEKVEAKEEEVIETEIEELVKEEIIEEKPIEETPKWVIPIIWVDMGKAKEEETPDNNEPTPTEKELIWNDKWAVNVVKTEKDNWNVAVIKALKEEKENTEKMFTDMVNVNEKLLSKVEWLEKSLDKFRKVKNVSWLLFEWVKKDETQQWKIWWIVKMLRG